MNLEDAEFAKEEFREKWDRQYPNIWKIIYTANAVESYYRMARLTNLQENCIYTVYFSEPPRRKRSVYD